MRDIKARHKIIGILILLGVLAALLSLPFPWRLLGSVLEEVRQELGLSEALLNAMIIGQASGYVVSQL